MEYNNTNKDVILTGIVSKEPDIRENSTKIVLKVKEIEGNRIFSSEKILIITDHYPEYQYGDELKIRGKLSLPGEFNDFNYKDYLASQGIYSLSYLPEISFFKKDLSYIHFPFWGYSKILSLKKKFREIINGNFSPPQSSILGAMILGDKSRISADWKKKLNIAGLRHITCISGMHIIILSGILMWLGLALGLMRRQAFYFAVIFLSLFILMVGAPASAVRAGIMAGLFLFAQSIGRLGSGKIALTFAATLMLFQNPLLLKSDVGFQLSFLATLGIVYLMPIFQNWLSSFKNNEKNIEKIYSFILKLISPVKDILAMTLAAQIFTLPILIYNFGYFSLISPTTNVIVVPLLPYIMVLGFIFIIGGFISPFLGWILSWPVWLMLNYLLKIVDWFSYFHYFVLRISWIWLIIFYLFLTLIVWRLQKRLALPYFLR